MQKKNKRLSRIINTLFICIIGSFLYCNTVYSVDFKSSLDRKIKKLIYSPNEVYLLELAPGYQTIIEFGDNEIPQKYALGNPYISEVSVFGNRLLIRSIESNIETNMTVFTNKNAYYFYIKIKNELDNNFAYVIRFFYPEKKDVSESNNLPNQYCSSKTFDNHISEIKPYNFKYTILDGESQICPSKIFDDGVNTFFEYAGIMHNISVYEVKNGKLSQLDISCVKNYYVIPKVHEVLYIKEGVKCAVIRNSNKT